ncbi:hypothetical protein CHS0354_022669 [Potamilus streckersoni]|nr:hypothetical protein CHS0354_022669 [Potamilus streckersoni]
MDIFAGLFLCQCLVLTLAATGCPNIHECQCTFSLIDCSGRNLTSVPRFMPSDTVYQTLRLDHNRLTYVPNNSFFGIKVSDILLNDNIISSVDHGAFYGVEDRLNELDMSINKLHYLPSSVGTLNHVRNLDISDNPIDQTAFVAGEDVLRRVGDTLYEFSFGHDIVYEWPHILRHLVALKTLNVLGGSFKTLPPGAFHGFEGTLLNLRIENTKLIALPVALSRLIYLQRLNFDHNHNIGDAGILVPAFSSTIMRYLTDLTLKDNSLTVFPNILKYLQQVRKLSLEGNKLDIIGDNSIQIIESSNVEDLSLRNCSLNRVPGAISRMRNLHILDLSANYIRSFERNDFTNMSWITNLTVTDNPLDYISPDAFNGVHNLMYLNLQGTMLREMPNAIENTPTLRDIILPSDQIMCTCDLAWLRRYMDRYGQQLHVQGTCETIISEIRNYLTNFIPMCPNYAG